MKRRPTFAVFRRGAILLDVVLALGLFVGMAAVMSGALNMSIQSTERLRRELTAENLAVTVVSELQAGMRFAESMPDATPFQPPRDAWTLQVLRDDAPTIEVVIRHLESDVEYRLAFLQSLQPDVMAADLTEVVP